MRDSRRPKETKLAHQDLMFTYVSTSKHRAGRLTRQPSYCHIPTQLLGMLESNTPVTYTKGPFLGSGGEGNVYRFTNRYHTKAPKYIAIKERLFVFSFSSVFNEAQVSFAYTRMGGYTDKYSFTSYVEGNQLIKHEFNSWLEFLNFAIDYIKELEAFHKVATHNDLHSGENTMVDRHNKAHLIDYGCSNLKKLDTSIMGDNKNLIVLLRKKIPLSKPPFDPKIINSVNSCLKDEKLSHDKLLSELQKIELAEKLAFDQARFHQLKKLFEEQKLNLEITLIKNIQVQFENFAEKKELNGAADIMLGRLLLAKKEAKVLQSRTFSKPTALSNGIAVIIEKFQKWCHNQHPHLRQQEHSYYLSAYQQWAQTSSSPKND